MKILLNHLLSNPGVNVIKEKISFGLNSLEKKVALVAILIFGVVIAVFSHRCFCKGMDAKKVKLSIPERLEKNRKFALDQQNQEKAKIFVITDGPIPDTLTPQDKPLNGKREQISNHKVGSASCEGIRPNMEDADLATEVTFTVNKTDFQAEVFGVFDGHGGASASAFVQKNLAQYLKDALESNNQEALTEEGIFKALKACFKKLNEDYKDGAGTTATVAVILGNKLWVANVGDSRTILVKKDGSVTQASEDAKPEIERYKRKIESLGGFVEERAFGPQAVNGILAVARAIGDKALVGKTRKAVVSPDPKITNYALDDFKEGYLVLACDGLYDVATSNEVGKAIKEMADSGETEENMAKRLVQAAIVQGSTDNVSAMVIKL
jgi:protein phosphatase 1L